MKVPLIYVQEPNALKNWLTACRGQGKILYDLVSLAQRYSAEQYLLLIQITKSSTVEQIIELSKTFDVLVTSNEPSDAEGLLLFQNGAKGYINTYSTVERIEQALETIQSGNVWLGQSIMQMMIQSLQVPAKANNESWKSRLTERECQTVELVLESKNNKQIAQQLDITERTVKAHLHNVFEKLEVKDRLGLALKIKNWH